MKYGIIKDNVDWTFKYGGYKENGEDWDFIPNTISMTARGSERKLRKAVSKNRYDLVKEINIDD
jgi:hypothetical protein